MKSWMRDALLVLAGILLIIYFIVFGIIAVSVTGP